MTAERLIFCAACSEPVDKRAGAWEHLDAACGADCADARGDAPIIPLEGWDVFRALPYDPRETLRALERKDA